MMKNVLLISTFLLTMTGSTSMQHEVIEVKDNLIIEIIEEEVNLINGKIDNREELIEAMAFVESGGNPAIIGDLNLGSPSVGLLQIRPIMVREVNRILRKRGLDKRFKNSDRRNGDKSIEMFNIWADAYHLDSSFEKMARNWNGGPKGFKKPATSHYWKKVQNYAKINL
jgi:hypothetical protein|tara:strand:+ start:2508 stop:3014 length:507 start_codon:yes stop_codon:yes gene_type:complete